MIMFAPDPQIVSAAAENVLQLFAKSFPRIKGPITRLDGDLVQGTREHLVFGPSAPPLPQHQRLLEQENFGVGTRLINATHLPAPICGDILALVHQVETLCGIIDQELELLVVQFTKSAPPYELGQHRDPQIWDMVISVTLQGTTTFVIAGERHKVGPGGVWIMILKYL